MHIRTIIGIVALACVSICGILGTFVNFEKMDKVNEKLEEKERFDWLGWHLFKYERLNREYKRFYPDRPLLFQSRTLIMLMMVCLVISAWGFGFFDK